MENLEQPEAKRKSDKAVREELMKVLKGHFRPEFLNRIDEVIVFHALSKENIRSIVQIQLDRVVRTAAAQDITLKMSDALVDHLVEVGYQPEFGARELKRQIRQQVETRLAKEILGDALQSGDTVEIGYDKTNDETTFSKLAVPPDVKEGKPAKKAKNGGASAVPDGKAIAADIAADDVTAEPPPPPPKKNGKGAGKPKSA
jgi:ATP-dependent Clp protease ATP-binding subunit ClpC